MSRRTTQTNVIREIERTCDGELKKQHQTYQPKLEIFKNIKIYQPKIELQERN